MEKRIKEIRVTELKAADEMIVEGYAATFNDVTDLGYVNEVIDPKAFDNCDMTDVCMKYNHSDELLIMARTRNGSLKLSVDDHGLKVYAELIDTTQNRDLYKMIQSKLLTKMSFAFTVAKDEYDYDTDTRRILEIDKLFDVSVVDVPAYESTEVYARSKEQYEEDKEKYRKLQLAKKKALAIISL